MSPSDYSAENLPVGRETEEGAVSHITRGAEKQLSHGPVLHQGNHFSILLSKTP